MEPNYGGQPLVLVRDQPPKELIGERPWMSIAEKIEEHLLTSLQNVRNEMQFQESQFVEQSFVARFGKILFYGPLIDIGTSGNCSDVETALSQAQKLFYANISSSYMEAIEGDVIPKIGFEFVGEEEYYLLKVADKTQPDATISCKCSVKNDDGKLEIDKIELKQIRRMVVDISCLDKNLDLRLMLSTPRILTDQLTDDEKDALRILIESAIIDPNVKGGLRWALGKECFGDRYRVIAVWHTKLKAFKSSQMSLKLRHGDKFDFRTSIGETSNEISLRMTGISGCFRDQMVEPGSLMEMLQDALKLIWDHFLDLDCTFV